MPTFDQIRALYPERATDSDEAILDWVARTTKLPIQQVAEGFDYDLGNGGKNAKRVSASVDSYQANMYGLGEAVAARAGLRGASEWMGRRRQSNEVQAAVASGRARDMGAVENWSDVHGPGDFADYAVGLGIQSLPYAAEALAGGGFGGAIVRSGARQALARTAGAVAASYPSSVGDILANQREQSGTMDLGSAAAYGAPYAAANAFGVEGALARGKLFRSGVSALDDMSGARGALARTGATALRTAGEEAAGETFQEAMNQLGRMSVDPSETFLNPRSAERFTESAIGGGVLGGLFGGAGGGWRRSAAPRTVDEGSTDLFTGREPLELSSYAPDEGPLYGREPAPAARAAAQPMPGQYGLWNPDGTPTYAADPTFSDTNPLRPMEPSWSTVPGAADPRTGVPFTRDIRTSGLSLVPRLDDGRTIDMFTGEPTHAPAAPDTFELTPPDMSGARQMDLPLAPAPVAPREPVLPMGRQRGVPGQLQYSGNTTSPKGQVLQGLVESLAAEGHMDDGTMTQASTLIAQGKFAMAKKLVDEAMKNKQAADAMIEKAARMDQKEANRANPGETSGGRPGNADRGTAVQRGASAGNDRPVPGQPQAGVGAAAPAPAANGAAAAPAVPADAQRSDALTIPTEQLILQAEEAKDIHEYEEALDELYRRWRDDADDGQSAAYFEQNMSVPGFKADFERVKQRAGDVAPKPLGQEGKRGLKLGRHPQGNLSPAAKETDAVLRGLAAPKFSRDGSSRPADARHTARVRALLEPVLDLWANQPKLVVHDSILSDTVPAEIKSEDDVQRANGATGSPAAVYFNGEIHVFADQIGSTGEALTALFHEGLGHYGLRGVFGKALVPILRSLAKARPDLIRAKAREYGLNLQSETDVLTAAEEVLAGIAQSRPGLTWVQQAVAAIRTWLRENVPGFAKLQLSDNEIIRDYVLPARNFVEQGRGLTPQEHAPAVAQPEDATPKFSRTNPSSSEAAALGNGFARVPYAHTTLGQKIQDALFNLRESPWALKWITNDQIAEGFKHLKPVQEINRATLRMASVANRYLETASQTAKKWRALPDDVQLAMQKVMLKSTMDEMHVSIKDDNGKYLDAESAWKHPSNAHIDKTPANRVAFGKLYAEFHALPAAAKNVYDTVRDDLARQHDDTLKALRKSVADQYATQLKRQLTDKELLDLANSDAGVKAVFGDTMAVAGSATEIRALNGLYQALRDVTKDFGTIRGPYFPLVRFGDHVVVMKSAALVDLEQQAMTLRAQLQEQMDKAPAAADEAAEAHDALVADLRNQYNRALDAVHAAKQDEKKYVVEFHETPAQAERARQELAARHPDADVYRSVREQYYRALDGASPAFLNDLTQTLAAALDTGDGVTGEAKSAALQAVKDMYLRRQPERSALRSELKRMNIEGVQAGQMLRGYAQSARNGAWRISRLLHAGEVTQGLQALSEDRRSPDAKHVLNELKARFVGDLAAPANNRVLERLQNATYFMHLGFNVSYFVTNATQAWTTSLPVMAGRHGIVNAANSLTAASKDVISLLSKATAQSIEENGAMVGLQLRLSDEQIASLAKDEGEARMLKALTDDGVIDITIKHDLGAISDGTTRSWPGKVMEVSSALANYPELYNRLATALAAYRMEMARAAYDGQGDAQERAQAYAETVINRTHFNYSPENAPRMMRGQLGRLVFQFKRYQEGMIYLFAKLIRDSSNGDKDSARALAYLLGMTTAVGGVAALPIAAPVALALKVLAAAYPDDDEPEWLQQWYAGMKDGIGEPAAQALAKGAPTLVGLDLSKKIGQGDLLNPVAFANTDGKKVFSRDYWAEVGFSLLGPGAALLGNEAEAVGAAKNGEFLRAAEKGMPTFVANAVKAYRRADEGLTTRQGDTIMSPEEFNALSVAAKALGFESAQVSDTYDRRSAYLGAVKARSDARQALLREYYDAVKAGDSEKVSAVRERINEFNARQPADRLQGKDLAASIKTHAQRARETQQGLRVGKRDRDTFNRVTGQE